MTLRLLLTIFASALLGSLSACGGATISETCNEVKAYQLVVPGKRVVVPDGLDPLDDFKEMPIPKSQTPPRPANAGCIESPPAIGSGSTRETSE